MLDKLKNLINVKSIITILLTVVFCILTIKNRIPQEFLTIYTTIIAFYFGTQYQKGVESKNTENEEK
nr:MAG TPA: hypothetical protein [Caudoviricetes sp.]